MRSNLRKEAGISMVDLVDLAINVLGWVVAGLVTLLGVWFAHRREDRSRERHDDRIRVFEPLRGEMVAIAAKAHTIKGGGWGLWSRAHASEQYTHIVTSGLLQDRRHDRLREDIEELHRSEEEYGRRWSAFANARRIAIAEALEGAKALARPEEAQTRQDHGRGAWLDRQELLERLLDDSDLLEALSAENPEGWDERLRSMFREFTPEPRTLYDLATTKVRESREAYRTAAKALIEHAAQVRVALDWVMHEGKPYLGRLQIRGVLERKQRRPRSKRVSRHR